MTYFYYEYPKCSTCKAAKKELLELGITFTAIDLKTSPPTSQQLKTWLDKSDMTLKAYFNTSGNSYRALGLKEKWPHLTEDEALTLLAADGMLIKRPLLIKGDQLLQVGYKTPYKDLGLVKD